MKSIKKKRLIEELAKLPRKEARAILEDAFEERERKRFLPKEEFDSLKARAQELAKRRNVEFRLQPTITIKVSLDAQFKYVGADIHKVGVTVKGCNSRTTNSWLEMLIEESLVNHPDGTPIAKPLSDFSDEIDEFTNEIDEVSDELGIDYREFYRRLEIYD